VVSFDLQTQIAAGLERVRGLKDDIKTALGVGDVALTQDDGRWRLRVARPDDPPVPLLKLLASIPALPSRTAALGLADSGRPVLARFSAGRVGHVLIAGEPGAGKTSLLRAIAAGLAFTNRQSELQLQILEPICGEEQPANGRHSPLMPLGYLPHMMTDPTQGIEACGDIIHFLAEEMNYRRGERVLSPRIIVFVDNFLRLLESTAGQVKSDLLRLMQYGPAAGIHLVLATDHPESPLLDATLKATMSQKIIGRLSDPALARRVAGVPLDQAALLYGEGDFLSVTGEEITYFQAAYIGDYDLHLKLMEMNDASRPRLLARPYNLRPKVSQSNGQNEMKAPQSFTLRDGVVDLEQADDDSPPVIPADESPNLPF
jgi:S-DNA-T family DNA segregation ATPase FtsK/SpoIIIE